MEENQNPQAETPQNAGGDQPQPQQKRRRISETQGRFNMDQESYGRPYQPRTYGATRTGGYQRPSYQSQDNNGGAPSYSRGGYQPRPNNYQARGYQRPSAPHTGYNRYQSSPADPSATPGKPQQEGGYNSRPQQEGGYQPSRPQQGGYNSRPQQEGGYQPRRPQQGGYNSRPQQEGGYQPRRPQQGGYNGRPQQGGYGRPQQGGYNGRPQQGGYGRQQGGYGRPQQGGYDRNGYAQRGRQGARKQAYNPHRPVEYTDAIVDPNEELRLNKYLANAGVCSRREADEHIKNGSVKVNGNVVTELGTKVTRKDSITFNDTPVSLERKVYVLLNKPKDTVTTSDDPQGRQTVMDLVRNASRERIYPVGRLDRNTTGVILLTNDGDLASKLTHPKYVKKKIYHVWLDKDVTEEDLAKIAAGVELEDGMIHADAIAYANEDDKNQVGIEIHSGKNRIVRRIFEHLGYRVTKLDRVYFAGLTKKNLPRGRWRHLTQQEVNMLKMGAFE